MSDELKPCPSGHHGSKIMTIDTTALEEALAQFLHDEGGFDEVWQATWPEHPTDTGQREGGFVRIVPSDVVAKFRDVAARWLRKSAAASAAILAERTADKADIARLEARVADLERSESAWKRGLDQSEAELTTLRELAGKMAEALSGIRSAMLTGGDGSILDFGWSITRLNSQRRLVREVLATWEASHAG